MKKIYLANLAGLFLYGLSYWLYNINFPYLIYPFGLAVFFLPGLNLALALEQITLIRQGRGKLCLWALLISLIITPSIIYYVCLIQGKLADPQITLVTFLIFWLASFLLTIGMNLWRKFPATSINPLSPAIPLLFKVGLGIFLTLTIINLLLYPFIPEADGYGYLLKLDQLFQHNPFYFEDSRPIFTALSWSLVFISKIPAYWLYKIIFPLLSVSLVIIFYQLSLKIKRNLLKIIALLAPVLFPVIPLELLISRPQIIFLIAWPMMLYLIATLCQPSFQKSPKNYYWFLLLISLAVLGTKIHEFFILAIFINLLGLIVFLWPTIKKNPLESFLAATFIAFSFYPWLNKTGAFELLGHFLGPFINAIKHPQFNFWFIDDYFNVDGNPMGWPGWSAALYYGYNWGLAGPFLVIIWLFYSLRKIKKITIDLKNKWVYLISALLFFPIAEIFPRLGLAYLPDRAWLFTVISLAFFIPSFLQRLEEIPLSKTTLLAVTFVSLVSLAVPLSITYAKQGWTSRNEYRATQFIKNQIPENAIILSQGGNNPAVSYFANRILVVPAEQFVQSGDLTDLKPILDRFDLATQKALLIKTKQEINQEIQTNTQAIIDNANNKELRAGAIERLTKNNSQLDEVLTKLEKINQEIKDPSAQSRPVYFLYSKEKFANLYNQREWWKKFNLYTTDIEIINQKYPLIYHQNGIYLWEIK